MLNGTNLRLERQSEHFKLNLSFVAASRVLTKQQLVHWSTNKKNSSIMFLRSHHATNLTAEGYSSGGHDSESVSAQFTLLSNETSEKYEN